MPRPAPAHAPQAMHQRAEADLRFIRQTMEQSATFTAVPGRGGAAMGALGLAGAVLAAQQPSAERWLAVWIGTAVVAAVAGGVSLIRKAAGAGVSLRGVNARRFGVGLVAPFAAGAGVTYALWTTAAYHAMPVVWLLVYGAGCLTGGAFSVPAVRAMGTCFMLLGFAAALTPASLGNVWLGAGFGGLQVVFGLYIARHHGG